MLDDTIKLKIKNKIIQLFSLDDTVEVNIFSHLNKRYFNTYWITFVKDCKLVNSSIIFDKAKEVVDKIDGLCLIHYEDKSQFDIFGIYADKIEDFLNQDITELTIKLF